METCIAEKWGAGRRIITTVIAAALAALTLICFVMMHRSRPGMNIIFYMMLAFSAVIVALMSLQALRKTRKFRKLATVLRSCLLITLAIGVIIFSALQGLILIGARTEEAQVDGLIILGAGLNGEYPSRILKSRLDMALEFMDAQEEVPIIVSGGLGPGETITEAEAMYRYLKRHGTNENRIWKEETSTNTMENLAFSLALMEENGMDTENATIAIVTNEFHLYRAKHLAGTLGLDAIGVAAETPYPSLRILYHFREAAALLKDIMLNSSVLSISIL